MPLLAQWTRQRPWLAAGLTGAASGVVGIAGGLATFAGTVGAMAFGGISTRATTTYEHPLRRRILTALEARPGLCYRELQTVMNTANGTLRHHLDVLQTRRAVTVMPVNGRTCYFAGGPSQVEVLRSKVVGEERMAQQLPIGLSPVQRLIIENIDREGVPRSQAALARRLGRTRATVHSAVKVLRRRGILREDRIELMPHIDLEIYSRASTVDYEFVDERRSSSN
ncbi:MAG: helix-turn-helix domain-containing protein [Candidatus Thermoplasmatota archaeon]|nr:helix-turn-helix domain-containing protein [Candidatus Thermoplasmatota archaeon]MEC8415906.1 helix-turn-helix domain-containing protein [Candidatus Thermoplasmatota archaeon]MEC8519741.1 helix-turn-helix domain-containing protein [Candidatus Thermoplasmatota archaeon]MEC8576954.1 helix-turn-helix domain-containing protein [Candidatus Thermoplasmatota archaeon]MEE2647451.1 helix-turn-helix domain-containing protein [Candidatus Thermoplasmatota archaeon]